MTDEQERLLLLLAEFDKLCALAGCSYTLIEHQLFFAVRSLGIRGCEADVAMLYSDYQKFASMVDQSNLENRAIESLWNNPTMPGWYFRYVDTSTTLFMLDYHNSRKFHAIGINIHILRLAGEKLADVGVERHLLAICETGLQQGVIPDYADARHREWGLRWQGGFVSALRSIMGSQRFSEWLSRTFPVVAANDDAEDMRLIMPRGRVKNARAGFVSETMNVELSGVVLRASKNYGDYFADGKGSKWHSEIPYYEKEGYKVLTSTVVPFDRFMSDANDVISDKRFWKCWSSFQSQYYSVIEPARKKQTKWWNDFYFIEERYNDWKKIAPYKEDVLILFGKEEYDLLWLFFESYRSHIEKHAKNRLPLVLDEDIWDVVMSLYRINGNEGEADEFQKLHDSFVLPPIDGEAAEAFLAKPPEMGWSNGEFLHEYVLRSMNG